MKSYEALHAAINGKTVEHSKKLGLATVTVNKWQEPHTDYTDSGAYNPLDRLITIISTIEKIAPERAYTPIKYLCDLYGFLPPVKKPTGTESDKDILKAILKWNEEFGETCAEISRTMQDGKITEREFKKCHKEAMEDIEALLELLEKMRERVR